MEHNAELNRTVADDAKARDERKVHIEQAVESFRVSVEKALARGRPERRHHALDRADA